MDDAAAVLSIAFVVIIVVVVMSVVASVRRKVATDAGRLSRAVTGRLSNKDFDGALKLIKPLPNWPIKRSFAETITCSSELFHNLEAAGQVVGPERLELMKAEVLTITSSFPYLAGKLASLNFQTQGKYRHLAPESRKVLEKESRDLDAISDACRDLSRIVQTFTASGRLELKEFDDGVRRLKAQTSALQEALPEI